MLSKPAVRKTIVAIDGPAGSGKSSVAKALSEKLRIPYLDTGAMYRALTYLALCKKIDLSSEKRMTALAKAIRLEFKPVAGGNRVFIDGLDVTHQIRTPELTNKVHLIAAQGGVRKAMQALQRKIAAKKGGVVEGRDIGTAVFPDTPYKFYFDADVAIRAKRRYRENKLKNIPSRLTDVLRDVKLRDKKDFSRKIAPLSIAKDAHIIDTTELTIPEVVDRICHFIQASRSSRSGSSPKK